jgi:hypothetical protein
MLDGVPRLIYSLSPMTSRAAQKRYGSPMFNIRVPRPIKAHIEALCRSKGIPVAEWFRQSVAAELQAYISTIAPADTSAMTPQVAQTAAPFQGRSNGEKPWHLPPAAEPIQPRQAPDGRLRHTPGPTLADALIKR